MYIRHSAYVYAYIGKLARKRNLSGAFAGFFAFCWMVRKNLLYGTKYFAEPIDKYKAFDYNKRVSRKLCTNRRKSR